MNVYAICFDDNRIKVGVTANVLKRMRYFAQEARRNRVSGFTWFSAGGFRSKENALLCERVLCRTLASDAMPGHREWVEGGAKDFEFVLSAIAQLRHSMHPACEFTDDKWGRVNFSGGIPSFGGVK